jgi:hypothetical protein
MSNDFDEAGVSKYVTDKIVLSWFRKTVQLLGRAVGQTSRAGSAAPKLGDSNTTVAG